MDIPDKHAIDASEAIDHNRKITVGGICFEDMRFGRVVCITQISRKPIVKSGQVFARWLGELWEVLAYYQDFDIDGKPYRHVSYRLGRPASEMAKA